MKKTSTCLLTFIALAAYAQQHSVFLKNIIYVPAKTFLGLSFSGTDSLADYTSRNMSVPGFYISRTEVTNAEYLQFTRYVRDSTAHVLLEHFKKGTTVIDWDKKILWRDKRLKPLLLSPEENFSDNTQIDPARLQYEIDFLGKKEIIPIYPDTLVWMSDFSYSYNEPLVKKYFSHPSYQDFPVVGVNLKQAMAFCQWKTDQLRKQFPDEHELIVRLPANHEWEAAAMEQKDIGKPISKQGYVCNFGTITDKGFTIKEYDDDGYFYTSPVKKFPPNSYGLYDMKGNVAEWTLTDVKELGIETPATVVTGFVVKGGGWNSGPFYLQAGACQFYSADVCHSFIGFRYVAHFPGKK